ncbi:PREDICTED: fas apoptotic inhibitory molecule 1 isoform X2 [Ceratosolen solmsi marchali]|uniref:Fas apoptotic inhibitory molecule 1 isoform X2 n=1 Tax=Ceratosolen solmsi marchali TaxID=326594 RepID=A0AAJ6VKR6_9HYME|nr:PREDICTED: fas apoptotic inhibitory molecule 1 isoform X2 [Ceratosolen solmsi marchali]
MTNSLLRSLQALESFGSHPTARWEVPLSDGIHVIEFDHGTATGRRVVKIDGKLFVNREWMFRLVGDEVIKFKDVKFVIRVDPIPGLRYSYSLWVDGKSFKSFIQAQSKVLETWSTQIAQNEYRIILDKNTQNVWINGEQTESEMMELKYNLLSPICQQLLHYAVPGRKILV